MLFDVVGTIELFQANVTVEWLFFFVNILVACKQVTAIRWVRTAGTIVTLWTTRIGLGIWRLGGVGGIMFLLLYSVEEMDTMVSFKSNGLRNSKIYNYGKL